MKLHFMSLGFSLSIQEFYCLCMSKKNNLNFNNLDCQISTKAIHSESFIGGFMTLINLLH
jgi:hypothetical protein